jgi:hypothetical protein
MCTRAWFIYNSGSGDPLDSLNYFYTTITPSCSTGRTICGILGLYCPEIYGHHPAPFVTGGDPNLAEYITDAQASGSIIPPLPFQPYVFVKAP